MTLIEGAYRKPSGLFDLFAFTRAGLDTGA